MNPLCQSGAGIAGADRFVGRLSRHINAVGRSAENVFGTHAARDFRAVFILCDRKVDLDARGDITFPPAPDQRVAFGLQETVAGRYELMTLRNVY
jgi:hypothetical protein